MTVAILSGTGFLGTAIAEALVEQGERPLRIARGVSPVPDIAGAPMVRCDRTDGAGLAEIFADHGVTTVIDVLTLSLNHTRPLLEATASAGARYVMISAIDVYANYGGLMGMETPPVLTRPTREDDPLRSALYPYRGNPRRPKGFDDALLDDYDKIPIEEAARADPRLGAMILRLPAIYGPGDRQGRFAWIEAALAEPGPIRIDERAAAWQQSFVYLPDAAAAVARAALSDTEGETFNIATPLHRSMGDWARHIAALTGREGDVETVSPGSGGLLSDRAEITDMRYPLTLDGRRFAARFGSVARGNEDDSLRAALTGAG